MIVTGSDEQCEQISSAGVADGILDRGIVLPRYAHRYSPKKFTQPQLFACLVLKEFLQLDYRKLAALLIDCLDLCATIDLDVVPHFTTFQKAAQRLFLKL